MTNETKPNVKELMLQPVGDKAELEKMLTQKRDSIVSLVGEARVKRFVSIMLAQSNRAPELLECTRDSVVNAIQHCALIGLMPGPRGDIYLIPFKNRKLGNKKELTVLLGYKGMMKLALQHPNVRNVEAACVYKTDYFEYNEGDKTIRHEYEPDADHDADTIIGAYSRVWFHDTDRPTILYYNLKQIESKRKRSKQPDGNFWTNDRAAMVRKTVIRGHYNGGEVPLTDELSAAMDRELAEEFKDAEVVSVRSESGVAAAKSAIGLGDAGREAMDRAEAEASVALDTVEKAIQDSAVRTKNEAAQERRDKLQDRLAWLHGGDLDLVDASLAEICSQLEVDGLEFLTDQELANSAEAIERMIEEQVKKEDG